MPETKELYNGTLTDLFTQRANHVRCLSDIDQAIAALQRVMKSAGMTPADAPLPSDRSLKLLSPPRPARTRTAAQLAPGHRFNFLSVRWAILILLDEAKAPMTQSEITESLESEGIRAKSKATNFANNVSAVLSNMRSPRSEVEVNDGKYEITEKGRSAIHHIKQTRGIA